mmetsp:Transcript_110021/g.350445  ORF Transcript_110021/g.350445 Transcript_110021/m.350445 type:complete len:1056 (+) Transcript_110021:84-3251(+)
MGFLVCTGNCVQPSWVFLELQIAVGLGLWAFLLLAAWGTVFYIWLAQWVTRYGKQWRGRDENVEIWLDKLEKRSSRISDSLGYHVLRFGLGLVLCALFCHRTYTNTVTDVGWLVEFIVCGIFLYDMLVPWFESCLLGVVDCSRYVALNAPLECLMFGSVILVPAPVNDSQTWASLSFLAAVHSAYYWKRSLHIIRANMHVLRWKIIDTIAQTVMFVFFAAMCMLLLERMGDPEAFKDLTASEWNLVSSVYFTISTVSTVGFLGLTPSTVLGKVFTVFTVCGGVSLLVLAQRRVNDVVVLQSSGGGSYEPELKQRHVVIAGNASIEMAKDFIVELLHQDHAEDAEAMHVVLLLPGWETRGILRQWLSQKQHKRIQDRVHVFQGSVMQKTDLLRVRADTAEAIFLLPNMQSPRPGQEDIETVMRYMAVRCVAPATWVILLLMRGASRQLLRDFGGPGEKATGKLTQLCADEMKLGLAGKSCQVAGFVPLLCNLVKCISGEGPDDRGERDMWQQEYSLGLGNEIYEVPLSPQYGYQQALFFQVVMDVLERTGGTVYLVGLVETRHAQGDHRVLVNPGPKYPIVDPIEADISGIFIASNREAILQCAVDEDLVGSDFPPEDANAMPWREYRQSIKMAAVTATPSDIKKGRPARGGDRIQELELPEADLDPRLIGMMRGEPRKKLRQLVALVKQQSCAQEPPRPSAQLLGEGRHVLLLCTNVAGAQEFRLGAEHFVQPLRQDIDARVPVVPVVIMAPTLPGDWESLAKYQEVYFMKGSALSEFDIERANVRGASAIFICSVGSASPTSKASQYQAWWADTEPIRCCRLVESRLPPGKECSVIVELACESNHIFIPIAADSAAASLKFARNSLRLMLPSASRMSFVSLGTDQPPPTWMKRQLARLKDLLIQAAGPVHVDIDEASKLEYFRSARYSSGQLFVDDVVTALMANTLYNPSLCDLVSSMIAASVTLVKVPLVWVGKSYLDFFVHLLWEKGSLALGLMRRGTEKLDATPASNYGMARSLRRNFSFVFTAPPAKETVLLETDRVICFSISRRHTTKT